MMDSSDTSRDVHTALGPLLERLGPEQRLTALRDVAAGLQGEQDLTVAAWLLTEDSEKSDSILESALRQFLTRLRDNGSATAVAKLCQSSDKARQWLLESTVSELSSAMSTITLDFDRKIDLDQDADTANARANIDSNLIDKAKASAILQLHFMLSVFEAARQSSYVVGDTALLETLTFALKSEDALLSRAARNVLSSWLRLSHVQSMAKLGERLENGQTVQEFVWSLVLQLAASDKSTAHQSIAFWLWSQILKLDVNRLHLTQLMTDDNYWALLQNALIAGDMEIKRNSVSILRQSVTIAAKNIHVRSKFINIDSLTSKRVLNDFEKFCTVYETISLGRYIGQIKDAIPTLNQLAATSSALPAPWLLSILQPAVSLQMPESIRNLLGNWIIAGHFDASSQPEGFGQLLKDRILPWAMQGGLLVNSLRKTGAITVSDHGENLSRFIARLLVNHQTSGGKQSASIYMEIILEYMRQTAHKTSLYAITYLVQGIFLAAMANSLPALGLFDATTLADLPNTPGLSEPTRDSTSIMCHVILDHVQLADEVGRGPDSVVVFEAKKTNLRLRIDSLLSGRRLALESDSSMLWSSLREALDTINAGNHSCLRGAGLTLACQSISKLMKVAIRNKCDESVVGDILDAIWQEIERQDYPKSPLITFPEIWLSPVCLELCKDNSVRIRESISFFIQTYNEMSQGRIFAWSPFVLALRRALLTLPHVLTDSTQDTTLYTSIYDFIISNANKLPTARPEFRLETAVSHVTTSLGEDFSHLSYQAYFGELESVGNAAFFDIVNRFGMIDRHMSLELLNATMEPWKRQKLPIPVVSKWKTAEQLQIIHILLSNITTTCGSDRLHDMLDTLVYLLQIEPLPRYRWLLEVIVSSFASKSAEMTDKLFDFLSTNDHHSQPKFIASLTKVTTNIICSSKGGEEMARKFIERALAFTSSTKIVIRHEAQWCFMKLWSHAEKEGWSSVLENSALIGLNGYISSLDKQQHLAERLNSALNLDTDSTLSNLLCGRCLNLEPATVPRASIKDFERLEELDRLGQLDTNGLEPALPLGNSKFEDWEQSTTEAVQAPQRHILQAFDQLALQTKGNSYLSGSIEDFKSTRQHSGLMVVASLVDNPYNQGGLSRVAEIFGAAALYIASLSVLSNKDFESVAVSSHTHMDVEALKPENMVEFFAKKRLEGYSIAGIEQTDRSAVLGAQTTQLPKKTILVLGAEKDGMPAAMIAECDVLVEIPQRGYTRSMNVQTAAACVLYEYCRQHT